MFVIDGGRARCLFSRELSQVYVGSMPNTASGKHEKYSLEMSTIHQTGSSFEIICYVFGVVES